MVYEYRPSPNLDRFKKERITEKTLINVQGSEDNVHAIRQCYYLLPEGNTQYWFDEWMPAWDVEDPKLIISNQQYAFDILGIYERDNHCFFDHEWHKGKKETSPLRTLFERYPEVELWLYDKQKDEYYSGGWSDLDLLEWVDIPKEVRRELIIKVYEAEIIGKEIEFLKEKEKFEQAMNVRLEAIEQVQV